MNKALNGIKNMIWLAAIMIALVALLVGIIFALSHKYYGEQADGALDLSGGSKQTVQSAQGAQELDAGGATGTLNALNDSQDAGAEFVFGLTFLSDSSLASLADYGSSLGTSASAQIWTDSGSGLPAASAATTLIVSPSDGSQITPVNAAMVYQPKRLVIYLGADGLASATQESFIAGYEELITGIQSASADTVIVCCSIGSVTSSYSGTDGLTAELISQANGWIRTVCTDTGVYYADLASVLNDESGYLKDEYAGTDGHNLGSAGISALINYFRFHGGF